MTISSTVIVPLPSQSPTHGRASRSIVASAASAAFGTDARPAAHTKASSALAIVRRTRLTPSADGADCFRSQCNLPLLMTLS